MESITPDQVDAISRGKWNEARNGMSPALAQRLVEMGLTDEEAQALLDQEWNAPPRTGSEAPCNGAVRGDWRVT